MAKRTTLLTFEFVGLCLVAFLSVCNVTVFYNLFGYLASLGVPAGLRGLGHFLMGAGATALLVTVIPPERSGQAFGIYSVAILVAFGLVPTLMEAIVPHLPSPAHGYALATVSVLPAAWIVGKVRRRLPALARGAAHDGPLPWSEIRANVTAAPVAVLLLLNTSYFANWSGLFFLFKGYALEKGAGNVGTFFAVLTGIMIAIRLLAGRLFDRASKVRLMGASFLAIALAHLALGAAPAAAIPLVGALFGLGLGAGYPAINGLMFDCSPPHLRPLNANLMLFAVQGGSFLGPSVGGALVARHGFRGYSAASIALALAAAAMSGLLGRLPRGSSPRPAGVASRDA